MMWGRKQRKIQCITQEAFRKQEYEQAKTRSSATLVTHAEDMFFDVFFVSLIRPHGALAGATASSTELCPDEEAVCFETSRH